MTDHLATGMKRMIRTVARSASLSDRLGEQSRLLRLTGNRSTLDFRPAEHGASSWDFEMSITPTEPKPYGNAETREPVWRGDGRFRHLWRIEGAGRARRRNVQNIRQHRHPAGNGKPVKGPR